MCDDNILQLHFLYNGQLYSPPWINFFFNNSAEEVWNLTDSDGGNVEQELH